MVIIKLLETLEGIRKYIKIQAETGGDLFISFETYRSLVLDHWPNDMPDSGNWKKEMSNVLDKLSTKRNVQSIERSRDLKSFRDDALEAIHTVNTKFLMYSHKS
ncbi:hypothetical protein [Sphingobacterium sp. 2149]|uniref:hypothetical protein n=1 Tax=Sphingobacterium sp. 2149 TaxID=2817763 RepID=UPI002854D457|nr:hypothetical protein [Sphingobacterium sp. 2149]MDR6734148.1 hypothetical protein [Sphingobacterium sp. 2149]